MPATVGELHDPRRVEPGFDDGERAMLEGWLDYHRTTLLLKVEGLTEEQLTTRPIATSLLSLRGLVRHMADVEAWWFRKQLLGEDGWAPRFWDPETPDADFLIDAPVGFADDLATWQSAIDASRRAIDGRELTWARQPGAPTIRWVLAHMIEEYARHNGHADLLRELIDGTVGS
ncbi:protein of unknown function DUF664 [Acidimicrobium ferrooxidans DSM 10331]|uniref:Mini-circle protein n=1 Tax=Acidimicrobium ferrooxidans (strain DSM 10331 / JCM 15462 / NBRC 103882 / ICP) TaxID=525909 RepID=C7LYB6_ACIFD|nr:DinB family protein [Acidimicrobium ferrooxidans]ACU53724.1 protein of unknown function DUF664 [Acidimicrobium ferrooxidans DSM 10331]